jgi:guanylate kinase
MIVILGESGCGKTTLANYLEQNYGYKKIVTCTTRPKREHEIDGVDYKFISNDEFRELDKAGYFLETAIYNAWYYGTPKDELDDDNKIAILTPSGFRKLKYISDSRIVSFYLCISRRCRLIKLLQRGDDIEEAYRRSLSDVGMFDGIGYEVDYVLFNDNYKYTVDELAKAIIDLQKL